MKSKRPCDQRIGNTLIRLALGPQERARGSTNSTRAALAEVTINGHVCVLGGRQQCPGRTAAYCLGILTSARASLVSLREASGSIFSPL